MKKILIFTVALTMVATMLADIPQNYYSSASGKKGAALKTALRDIVYDHTAYSYGDLWKLFVITDRRSDDLSRVWDMYSNTTYYFNGQAAVSGMHKEHSFPKSWWGGSEDITEFPCYTDLNHLYPADGNANMAKSNWPLGEVNTSSSVTFDNNSAKVGTPVSGQGGDASAVFEPADEYKGDFARTYFYMVTCYQDLNWSYTWMVRNKTEDYRCLQSWAIDLLLKWNRQDPVSAKEISRNNKVYHIQHNRNPYIDHPELAEYVFGSKTGSAWSDSNPGKPLRFKLTSSVTPGKRYLIVANNNGTLKAMDPIDVTRAYQYPPARQVEATGDVITVTDDRNAFTLLQEGQGYYLKDCMDRYYYQEDSYKTLRVLGMPSASYLWTITPQSDGTFSIKQNGYRLEYRNTYDTYGVYTTPTGIMPRLYEEISLSGDVNGDGQITIADANVVIAIILNSTDSVDADTLARADVNGDGQITIADANAVIAAILSN